MTIESPRPDTEVKNACLRSSYFIHCIMELQNLKPRLTCLEIVWTSCWKTPGELCRVYPFWVRSEKVYLHVQDAAKKAEKEADPTAERVTKEAGKQAHTAASKTKETWEQTKPEEKVDQAAKSAEKTVKVCHTFFTPDILIYAMLLVFPPERCEKAHSVIACKWTIMKLIFCESVVVSLESGMNGF